MHDDVMLTLHCPQCRQITDVVTEGGNLVCLDCGWRFDDKTTSRVFDCTSEIAKAVSSPIDPAGASY
jgi:predicted Zn-ribbon and HTH transcriptional regulator